MSTIAYYWIGVVAVIQLLAGVAEMFFWPKMAAKLYPREEVGFIQKTKPMMANQGFYNLLLAAGLVWAMVIWGGEFAPSVAICFLLMVFSAGLFGAASVSRNIAYFQSAPAAIGLALVLLA